jgi:uncharacterized heparinase superfamily protein
MLQSQLVVLAHPSLQEQVQQRATEESRPLDRPILPSQQHLESQQNLQLQFLQFLQLLLVSQLLESRALAEQRPAVPTQDDLLARLRFFPLQAPLANLSTHFGQTWRSDSIKFEFKGVNSSVS